MNFQQLRSVREAVRCGFNLTEVAAALFTSQPGVSRPIRELEEELGVEIFVRPVKRLTGLAPPGKTLLPMVERLLLDAENLKRVGQDDSSRLQGRQSVAATHSQARYALPHAVCDFRDLYPQVALQLHQGSPKQIAEMLLSGEVDIGVATEALKDYPQSSLCPATAGRTALWCHLITLCWCGPGQWQSLWAERLGVVRVVQDDWITPTRAAWVATISRTILAQTGPVVIAAHSLGCIATTHLPPEAAARIQGALLVAPADPERRSVLADFAPIPYKPLPYPNILVASANDPYCPVRTAGAYARAWGSEFVRLKNAGHINVESGHGEWSLGLALLQSLLGASGRLPPTYAEPDVDHVMAQETA